MDIVLQDKDIEFAEVVIYNITDDTWYTERLLRNQTVQILLVQILVVRNLMINDVIGLIWTVQKPFWMNYSNS